MGSSSDKKLVDKVAYNEDSSAGKFLSIKTFVKGCRRRLKSPVHTYKSSGDR